MAATPLLSLAALVPDAQGPLAAAAGLDGLALGPAALIAAVCLYVAWRMSLRPPLAWLASGSAIVGIQGVTVMSLQLGNPARAAGQGFWMGLADLSVLLAVLGVALLGRHRRFRSEPAVAGIVGGLALGLVRLVAVTTFPHVTLHPHLVLVLLCWLVFAVPPAWLLARVGTIPRWARWRLSAAVVLFSLSHLATYLDGPHRSSMGSAATLLVNFGGTIVLVSAAVGLLRQVMLEGQGERDALEQRLDVMEAGVRQDRARIHEINSTIAGVISASRLLHGDADSPSTGALTRSTIGPERRRLLEDMVHAELSRLERLLNQPLKISQPRTVDLDHTIGNLVLAHEVRGRRVAWLPSGARVTGEPDEVAEVINILLDNAAKHGSAAASVSVEKVADAIEILISDEGPGVAPEIRTQLFEWGARGPRSAGQGIGLNIAADLTRRQGGYLRLRDGTSRGATFVVGLPAAMREEDESVHLA